MMLILIRRAALALACVSLLSACGSLRNPETLFGLLTPYRIDVVQGNVVTQEVMAQVQPGLGRLQVREILGTPLLTDPFHADRWDYAFTISRQGVPDQQRRVTVFFRNEVVDRIETQALPTEREFVASIDRPLGGDEPKLQMTPEQIAALPQPPKTDLARKTPQGAAREYPALEPGSR
jgi:outer membrane protein assembly factor BamE